MEEKMNQLQQDTLVLVNLNPRLKQNLLQKLINFPIKNTILVDQTIYPNKLLVSPQDAINITKNYDRTYFGKDANISISKQAYKSHRHSLLHKIIAVGDQITLLLDGKTYDVIDIDDATKTYTITESIKRLVTLRVPEAVIKR